MKPPLTVDVAHSPLIWTVGAASSTTTSSAKTGRAAGARSNTSEHNPARIRMPPSVVPGRCGGRDGGVTASSRTCDTLEYMRSPRQRSGARSVTRPHLWRTSEVSRRSTAGHLTRCGTGLPAGDGRPLNALRSASEGLTVAAVRVAAERSIDAPADVVYQCIANYQEHHRPEGFLPPSFSDFR